MLKIVLYSTSYRLPNTKFFILRWLNGEPHAHARPGSRESWSGKYLLFRKGKSCLSELLDHYTEIVNSFNEGSDTDAIFLDFAKAFDKVDHDVLLRKLQNLGITGELHNWIRSFLTNRVQKVTVDGFHSRLVAVLSGVPQGTALASRPHHIPNIYKWYQRIHTALLP